MENVYMRSAEIVRRMRMELPIHLTVTDPVSQTPITLHRDNLLEQLVVESHNLVLEGQTVAALYAEMGRFRMAAIYEQAKAEGAFRKWKARMAIELRDSMPAKKTAAGKPAAKQGPTESEVTQYYRVHADYDTFHDPTIRWAAIVDLLTDARRAFDIKTKVISDQLNTLRGHEVVMARAESTDRFDQAYSMNDYIAEVGGVGDEAKAALEKFEKMVTEENKKRTAAR